MTSFMNFKGWVGGEVVVCRFIHTEEKVCCALSPHLVKARQRPASSWVSGYGDSQLWGNQG